MVARADMQPQVGGYCHGTVIVLYIEAGIVCTVVLYFERGYCEVVNFERYFFVYVCLVVLEPARHVVAAQHACKGSRRAVQTHVLVMA